MLLKFRGTRAGDATLNGEARTFFVKRGRSFEYVRQGSVFKRRLDGSAFETAQVITIQADPSGIPHVRYRAGLEKPFQWRLDAGSRTLNLASFMDRFRERA